MAILEYYNGSSWSAIGGSIILTGAVSGSGNGTINTILSNSINITGTTQNLIFADNNLAALKLSSVSDTTEFVINWSGSDILKIGYDNTFSGASYINSLAPEMVYNITNSIGAHVFAVNANEVFKITVEGYVGIATSTPKALLQFGNTLQNRILVLWENNINQNNHEFCGFGINTDNILRYQIGTTTGAHRFYVATSSTTSTELFTITGTGNIGIGTAAPNAPLQFSNVTLNRKIVLWEDANNDHQFNGLGVNGGNTIRHQVGTVAGAHTFWAATSATTSNELFRITGTGFVGIGTSTPHAPLQFANPGSRRKIVLSETADNDYEFTGFGVVGTALIYNTGVTGAAHVFTTAATATSATELMRITGSGEIIADYIYADVPRFMYRLVNNTTTVTSTANTWIKIAGTTTGSLLNLFTHTDNRATYTGTRTVNMLCNVCATIFTSAGSDVSIRVYKNGTVVTPSQMTNSFTAANLRMNFNTQTIVSMATNDYLEVFIMCNVSGITLNTPFLTFTAHKI